MTKDVSIACSLEAGELKQRLIAIAEIGADSLIDRSAEGERQLLRFRSNATTYHRLEAIIAAEAKCCSALDFSLSERGDELVLAIAAPAGAEALAEGVAEAFAKEAA